MKNIQNILLLISFYIGMGASWASVPPNWNVNSSGFTYNMTLSAQVELNCQLNLNPNNTIAAFVGDECRGVASTSINGINIALMFIHSNTNNGDVITFKYYDAAADEVYDLSQTITFFADSALGTIGNPFVIQGTYHPSAIEINQNTIYDTTDINTIVGDLTVIDPDINDVYSLEILEELDHDHFHLSGNQLLVSQTPNVVADSLYQVVVKGTYNSTCEIVDTLEIQLVNTFVEPVFVNLTNDTIFDYSEIGDTLGQLSLSNNMNDGIDFQILDTLGTQYGYFVLVGNNLVLNHDIDILTETSYELYIRADGGTNHFIDSIFTVYINNTNVEPSEIKISNDTVFDYSNSGDLIGTFTVLDENQNASYTYTLDSTGTHQNDYFILTGNQLFLNHDIDILTETEYLVHIKAYDGVAYSIDSIFTIHLNNTNDEPTEITITKDTVYDYSNTGDLIGSFNVMDEDTNANYTFSFDNSGNHQNDYFILTGNQLFLNHDIDILTETEYLVHIKAYDGVAYSIDSIFTIHLNNTNDEPTEITITKDTVYDYSNTGDLIGSFNVMDEDTNANYTFSFDNSGNHQNDYFILTGNQLFLNHDIDILTETEYLVHIKAYDGVAYSIDSIFTIHLNNTNDEPTEITITKDTVYDYSNTGDLIGSFNVMDEDTNANYTFSFDNSGTHQNDYFILTGNQLFLNHDIDILTETEYLVHIKAYDGVAYSIDSIFTIHLNNTNDEPTEITISKDTVYDYSNSGDLIGSFNVMDEDTNANYTFSFDNSGTHQNDYFILTGNQLFLNHDIDILTETEYLVHIKAYDGVAYSIDSIFTIHLNNTNDEPTEITITKDTVYDYSNTGDLIGSFNVMDEDTNANYTFSFDNSGNHQNDYFILTGNQLFLNHDIDILTETEYLVHIKAYDGVAYSIDSIFTIHLNNTNDEPTEITITKDTVYDYSNTGDLIGSFNVMDEDTNANYTFSFDNSGNHQNDYFILTGNQLFLNHDIDILTETEYLVHIKAYDGVAYSIDSIFTIHLNNTNDEPTEITITKDTVYDYSNTGDLIGSFNVMDEDTNANYTFSFDNSGNHQNDYFILTGNQIYLNHDIDILTETQYLVKIKAYDGVAYYIDSTMTIYLNNTNAIPTEISVSNNIIYDYSQPGDLIGALSVIDDNPNEQYTYSSLDSTLLDNQKFSLSGNNLNLNYQINAAQDSLFKVVITAYDGKAYTITDTISIVVNNTNIYPYSIDLSNSVLYDYSTIGDTIGNLSVDDANADETYTYSIISNTNDFFLLNNFLVLNKDINPLQDSIFSIQISGYDGSTWTIDSTFTILIENTNIKPSEIQISNLNITDTIQSGDLVGNLSVLDQNADETYIFSIQNGLYNANMFQILNNQLQFTGTVNPTIGQYQVGISAYDGSQWTIDSVFTISVENTNIQPTEIQISNLNITDTIQSGDLVGNLSVMDQNVDETYIFSIQNGFYNANMFQIVNNQLQFIGNVNPTIGQYQVGISAYDGSQWTIDSVFTISVENTNIQPTEIQISNLNITDTIQSGDLVGNLSVMDQNADETYIFTIQNGLDASKFQMVNNQLQFVGSVNPTIGQYQVEISAYDGSQWTIDSVFTITVENTNIQPTEIQISNLNITDTIQSGDLIGNLSVMDQNADETYIFSIQNGLYNANIFQIVNNQLQFIGNVNPTIGQYQVGISAYDGSQWTIDSVFTISVENTNIQPTEIQISNLNITDTIQSGDLVGNLSVMDQNASETYTYSIQNGLYNANMFQIVNNQLQFIGNVNPTIGQYQVGISAYDGSQWTIDSVFTISVENTNIQPTEIQISNLNITDTIQSGNLVGNLSVMDQNASETYTYSIQNGLYNANMFQIVNNQLQFIGNVNPTIGQYQVGISAYDGSQWTIDSVFTISVENTNIQPTQIQLSNLQITDQNQVLDMVGELSVIDPNQENYTYTINPLVLNGNMFQIVDNKIQVASTINPLAGQYQVEVSAYDGRLWTIDSVFTISVVNTNAKPTEIKLSNSVIYDHSSSGFEVGNLSVEDTNSNEEYAYTIKSGLDAQEFQLVDNSLQFVGVVDLSKAEYKVTINAYDGRLWNIDSVFTISVNNTNSQPTEMMISNSIITNNNQVGDSIASFNVIDADNDSYSYTLSQDLDGDKFNLVGKTLILLEEFNPSESKYHIKINAYDGKQHSIDSVFTLTLENNNQTPTSLELDHFEIDENAAKGTLIGYLSTEDDDNEHTYSLSFNNGDNDNSNFSINGNAIYSAKTFDYENQSEYSIEVTVSDKVGNKLSSNFDIQINDIIEIDHIEANNYLTPNGDGQNDYWEVENVELYKDYTLKIFNKQGQVVFEKNQDYNNDWSAENLPSGVYYYFLTSNSSSIEFSGVIHLVK